LGLGVAGTAAACARPYDAVLLLVPGLVWAARRRRPGWWRLAGWVVLGALPLTVAVAIYNTVATGRPWTLPFGLLEASDTVGFGVRRLVPEQDANHFGPLQGVGGLGLHFAAGLLVWTALGPLLVPAALSAWRSAVPATRMLLVSAGLHLAGFAMFWGPWNFSWIWRTGVRVLGPIYAMPLVVPVVLAGLPGLERWYRARPRRWRRLGIAAGLASLGVLVFAVQQAVVDAGRTDRVLAAAERARVRGPLLVDVDPPYLGHPVSQLVDDAALAAATPVPPPGAEPPPQLLQLPKPVYGFNALTYAVTPQERVEAPDVLLEVTRGGTRDRDVLVVERAGRTAACRLRDAGPLRLDALGVSGCDGAPVPRKWRKQVHRRCADRSCLALAVYRVSASRRERRLTWRLLPVDTHDASVALLVDGETLESTGRGWLRVARA